MNDVIRFEYIGVSPFEIETIYNILSKFARVDEKELADELEYVSLLNIDFPVPYDEYFFQLLGFDNWKKIKDLFKEMKRRRGRKGLKIILSFSGVPTDTNSRLMFSLSNDIGPQFEYAVEKIEHMMDSIHIQIRNLETKRKVASYSYDAIAMKWVLSDRV